MPYNAEMVQEHCPICGNRYSKTEPISLNMPYGYTSYHHCGWCNVGFIIRVRTMFAEGGEYFSIEEVSPYV